MTLPSLNSRHVSQVPSNPAEVYSPEAIPALDHEIMQDCNITLSAKDAQLKHPDAYKNTILKHPLYYLTQSPLPLRPIMTNWTTMLYPLTHDRLTIPPRSSETTPRTRKKPHIQRNLPAQPPPRRTRYPHTPKHRIRLGRQAISPAHTRRVYDMSTQEQHDQTLR